MIFSRTAIYRSARIGHHQSRSVAKQKDVGKVIVLVLMTKQLDQNYLTLVSIPNQTKKNKKSINDWLRNCVKYI